jgi:hypothetical protein
LPWRFVRVSTDPLTLSSVPEIAKPLVGGAVASAAAARGAAAAPPSLRIVSNLLEAT